MAKAAPFDPKWLRKDNNDLIDSFQLGEEQRHFLRSRWLEYVLWMEGPHNGRETGTTYSESPRLSAPSSSRQSSASTPSGRGNGRHWLTFAISLVVAVSAAVEGFFQFGARWRHYRSLVEDLKAEGWAFHELIGPYKAKDATHSTGFPIFVERVTRPPQTRDTDLHLGDRIPAEDCR